MHAYPKFKTTGNISKREIANANAACITNSWPPCIIKPNERKKLFTSNIKGIEAHCELNNDSKSPVIIIRNKKTDECLELPTDSFCLRCSSRQDYAPGRAAASCRLLQYSKLHWYFCLSYVNIIILFKQRITQTLSIYPYRT